MWNNKCIKEWHSSVYLTNIYWTLLCANYCATRARKKLYSYVSAYTPLGNVFYVEMSASNDTSTMVEKEKVLWDIIGMYPNPASVGFQIYFIFDFLG